MLLVVCVLAGCRADNGFPVEQETVLLQLSVATSEMSGAAGSRANTDYQYPSCEGEQIQTLRIIIVRPNLVVEHNKFFDLTQPTLETDYYEFKVLAGEEKKIYLIANEKAERLSSQEGQTKVSVVEYNFNNITEGALFPTQDINELTIKLGGNSEQLKYGDNKGDILVPMSECHIVPVENVNMNKLLFVTRLATKFTYHITNKSSKPCKLTQLKVGKMANEEYFFPHGKISYTAVGDDYNTLGQMDLSNYEVPLIDTNGYYEYTQDLNETLSVNEIKNIPAFYLLEGKYPGEEGYYTSITVNGENLENKALENVKQLPRNTHVVVNITINDKEVNWEVDVFPYVGVDLNPSFGL